MHDIVTTGILVLAILAGVLCNHYFLMGFRSEVNSETNSLRSDMKAGFAQMHVRFDQIDAHFDRLNARLSQIAGVSGRREGSDDDK